MLKLTDLLDSIKHLSIPKRRDKVQLIVDEMTTKEPRDRIPIARKFARQVRQITKK